MVGCTHPTACFEPEDGVEVELIKGEDRNKQGYPWTLRKIERASGLDRVAPETPNGLNQRPNGRRVRMF